jgi:hypothetical protein
MAGVGAPWRRYGDLPERGERGEEEGGVARGAAWGGGAMGRGGGARPCGSSCSLYVEVLQREEEEPETETEKEERMGEEEKEKKRKNAKIAKHGNFRGENKR